MKTSLIKNAALVAGTSLFVFGNVGAFAAPQTPQAKPRALAATYRNPLLRDVADPFVLKHRGEYYLYRTSIAGGGLDVSTSRDLVHWTVGPTVWKADRPDMDNNLVWAPECYYDNGVFYLVFSTDAAKEGGHKIWVATSDSPKGPFKTRGPLTRPWRIDPTVFTDWNGSRFLYTCMAPPSGGAHVEARSFVGFADATEAGWNTVIPATLPWEGGWTEGPTVLRDPDSAIPLYHMLYSGGGAMLPRYQVGYSTAPSPLGPWTKHGLLLETKSGVPGPGHQGVVMAPDNLTPYLIYHKKRVVEEGWQRDLMIDRLAFTNGKLGTNAPTLLSQPAPPQPDFIDRFDGPESLSKNWTTKDGAWNVDKKAGVLRAVKLSSSSNSKNARVVTSRTFRTTHGLTIEVNARVGAGGGRTADVELISAENNKAALFVSLATSTEGGRHAMLAVRAGDDAAALQAVNLPEDFRADVYHQILMLVRNNGKCIVQLDGVARASVSLPKVPATTHVRISSSTAAGGTFDGIAVTERTQGAPIPPATAAPTLPSMGGFKTLPNGVIEQRQLGTNDEVYVAPGLTASASTGTASVRVQGWAMGRANPYPKYGLRVFLNDAHTDYVDAYIDPPSGVLATHGVAGGKEILPWQNSDLPLGFEFTDEHRITVSWTGDRWRFAVDDKTAVQERTVALGASKPARFGVGLVTADSRAAFRDLSAK